MMRKSANWMFLEIARPPDSLIKRHRMSKDEARLVTLHHKEHKRVVCQESEPWRSLTPWSYRGCPLQKSVEDVTKRDTSRVSNLRSLHEVCKSLWLTRVVKVLQTKVAAELKLTHRWRSWFGII